ncbi:MAG: MerR family transcriptional regulator [Oscillospiraceae bacterium]|nr:MerR family transcriptional regulator [Oscillospiraceae bacterium]
MQYSIGEAAKKMNITTATLRYYDKEGLLPFVERTSGGARIFSDHDFRWLNLISCLKKAGMPLKDIRLYIEMTMQGEETIEARLDMFRQQRQQILLQIQDLQKTLDVVDYKCWYYETALAAGSESAARDMPLEEMPEALRSVRQWLRAESI